MEQSWSQWVGGQEWRQDAEQWIDDVLGQKGVAVNGPVKQPRIRPWSTQLVIPTDAGTMWFKANCPGHAFEAGLQQTLAGLLPEAIEAPVATDNARGWMLTADHGLSLGELHEPSLVDWQEVVSRLAQIQRALVGNRAELVDAGLSDCSPHTVPARFDILIERLSGLPAGHPSHLTGELVTQLEATRPQLVEATQQLEESPMPSTFQHGDAHPRNVYMVDGRMKIFDFGDSMWSSAPEAMSVPFGVIAKTGTIAWEPVRDAYREHWSDLVSAREYDALWHACGLTHAVNRSATWWRGLQGASEEEWAEPWGNAPRYYLTNVLDEIA